MNSRIAWRSRIRLVDEVAEALRESIYAGRFPPGTRLRQEEVAAQLDVSRTPLREALRILEREGLVEVEQNRGVRVTSADLPTLLAAYELREVIDGLAARLAARSPEPYLIELLRSIVVRQREALDPWNAARYTGANVDFHRSIIDAARNDYLSAQIPLVNMTSRVFAPVAHLDARRADRAIAEHVEIVAAIEAGLEEEAERVARRHIRTTIASMPSRWAEPGGAAAAAGEPG
jgi:DNA-binding GntR family transcriptional regulator